MNALDGALRHDRWITAAALAALAAISLAWVWHGAGMGMSALDMTRASLFPHLLRDPGGSMEAPWPVVVTMWWVMMIAMMTPGAAPLVLLHNLVLRRQGRHLGATPLVLVAGYLACWLAFSIAAAALQAGLERSALISGMMLWSRSAWFSALLLAGAGLYQLSPLKHACLHACRAPARYLMEHWRPGLAGSFLLGVRHGAYCVGCCWMLMALLFVGGVMNLLWVAGLAIAVTAEKLLPAGPAIARASGAVLLTWAAATLLV